MDYSKGISATYSAYIVDPDTMTDKREFLITGGGVDFGASSSLLQSATITTPEEIGEEIIRIYMIAEQGGEFEKNALFTGIASTPTRKLDGTRASHNLTCYSMLKMADDVLLPIGFYAPKGSGAGFIRELIGGEVVGISPGISEAVVADQGETRLSMARKIAELIDWNISIDGYGNISIHEKKHQPVATFGNANDIIELNVDVTNDWYSCPNVLRVITEDGIAIARDDEGGPLSVAARGREIWAEERIPYVGNIAEYARRRLKEMQAPAREVSYKRRYVPGVNVGDIVNINYPQVGITGTYKVNSQSLSFGYACTVSEKVALYEF